MIDTVKRTWIFIVILSVARGSVRVLAVPIGYSNYNFLESQPTIPEDNEKRSDHAVKHTEKYFYNNNNYQLKKNVFKDTEDNIENFKTVAGKYKDFKLDTVLNNEDDDINNYSNGLIPINKVNYFCINLQPNTWDESFDRNVNGEYEIISNNKDFNGNSTVVKTHQMKTHNGVGESVEPISNLLETDTNSNGIMYQISSQSLNKQNKVFNNMNYESGNKNDGILQKLVKICKSDELDSNLADIATDEIDEHVRIEEPAPFSKTINYQPLKFMHNNIGTFDYPDYDGDYNAHLNQLAIPVDKQGGVEINKNNYSFNENNNNVVSNKDMLKASNAMDMIQNQQNVKEKTGKDIYQISTDKTIPTNTLPTVNPETSRIIQPFSSQSLIKDGIPSHVMIFLSDGNSPQNHQPLSKIIQLNQNEYLQNNMPSSYIFDLPLQKNMEDKMIVVFYPKENVSALETENINFNIDGNVKGEQFNNINCLPPKYSVIKDIHLPIQKEMQNNTLTVDVYPKVLKIENTKANKGFLKTMKINSSLPDIAIGTTDENINIEDSSPIIKTTNYQPLKTINNYVGTFPYYTNDWDYNTYLNQCAIPVNKQGEVGINKNDYNFNENYDNVENKEDKLTAKEMDMIQNKQIIKDKQDQGESQIYMQADVTDKTIPTNTLLNPETSSIIQPFSSNSLIKDDIPSHVINFWSDCYSPQINQSFPEKIQLDQNKYEYLPNNLPSSYIFDLPLQKDLKGNTLVVEAYPNKNVSALETENIDVNTDVNENSKLGSYNVNSAINKAPKIIDNKNRFYTKHSPKTLYFRPFFSKNNYISTLPSHANKLPNNEGYRAHTYQMQLKNQGRATINTHCDYKNILTTPLSTDPKNKSRDVNEKYFDKVNLRPAFITSGITSSYPFDYKINNFPVPKSETTFNKNALYNIDSPTKQHARPMYRYDKIFFRSNENEKDDVLKNSKKWNVHKLPGSIRKTNYYNRNNHFALKNIKLSIGDDIDQLQDSLPTYKQEKYKIDTQMKQLEPLSFIKTDSNSLINPLNDKSKSDNKVQMRQSPSFLTTSRKQHKLSDNIPIIPNKGLQFFKVPDKNNYISLVNRKPNFVTNRLTYLIERPDIYKNTNVFDRNGGKTNQVNYYLPTIDKIQNTGYLKLYNFPFLFNKNKSYVPKPTPTTSFSKKHFEPKVENTVPIPRDFIDNTKINILSKLLTPKQPASVISLPFSTKLTKSAIQHSTNANKSLSDVKPTYNGHYYSTGPNKYSTLPNQVLLRDYSRIDINDYIDEHLSGKYKKVPLNLDVASANNLDNSIICNEQVTKSNQGVMLPNRYFFENKINLMKLPIQRTDKNNQFTTTPHYNYNYSKIASVSPGITQMHQTPSFLMSPRIPHKPIYNRKNYEKFGKWSHYFQIPNKELHFLEVPDKNIYISLVNRKPNLTNPPQAVLSSKFNNISPMSDYIPPSVYLPYQESLISTLPAITTRYSEFPNIQDISKMGMRDKSLSSPSSQNSRLHFPSNVINLANPFIPKPVISKNYITSEGKREIDPFSGNIIKVLSNPFRDQRSSDDKVQMHQIPSFLMSPSIPHKPISKRKNDEKFEKLLHYFQIPNKGLHFLKVPDKNNYISLVNRKPNLTNPPQAVLSSKFNNISPMSDYIPPSVYLPYQESLISTLPAITTRYSEFPNIQDISKMGMRDKSLSSPSSQNSRLHFPTNVVNLANPFIPKPVTSKNYITSEGRRETPTAIDPFSGNVIKVLSNPFRDQRSSDDKVQMHQIPSFLMSPSIPHKPISKRKNDEKFEKLSHYFQIPNKGLHFLKVPDKNNYISLVNRKANLTNPPQAVLSSKFNNISPMSDYIPPSVYLPYQGSLISTLPSITTRYSEFPNIQDISKMGMRDKSLTSPSSQNSRIHFPSNVINLENPFIPKPVISKNYITSEGKREIDPFSGNVIKVLSNPFRDQRSSDDKVQMHQIPSFLMSPCIPHKPISKRKNYEKFEKLSHYFQIPNKGLHFLKVPDKNIYIYHS